MVWNLPSKAGHVGVIPGQGAETPQAVGQPESLCTATETQHDKKGKKRKQCVCERERRREREKEHQRRWGGMERVLNLGAQDVGLHSSSAIQVRDWISAAWCLSFGDYLVLSLIPHSPKA